MVQPGLFFPILKRLGPSPQGLTHFVAAVLPNTPVCALKLGNRTSLTGIVHELSAGFRHAHSFSAAALLVGYGVCGGFFSQGVELGRLSAHYEVKTRVKTLKHAR